MSRVLVIDIGNTSTSVGLFTGAQVRNVLRIATPGTGPETCRRLLTRVSRGMSVDGTCVASVVPAKTRDWTRAAERFGRVVTLNHTSKLGVGIDYPTPRSIGPDRLANACGGACLYGTPLIVADFGTAVTFDCITTRRGYIGGIIAPGLPLMFDYLADRTALLPRMKPSPVHGRVGRSTRSAMQLGARWGYRGMVREILTELLCEPALHKALLVATGGYARQIVEGLEPAMIVDQHLTLYGLGVAFELNP